MVPVGGAVMTRLRLALAVLLGGTLAQLLPVLLPVPGELSPAVLLAVVAVALAAVLVLRHSAGFSVLGPVVLPPRTTDETPAFLAARATDPLHFPVRPRAPGQV